MLKIIRKVSTIPVVVLTSLFAFTANVYAQSAVLGTGQVGQTAGQGATDNNTLIILGICCLILVLLLGAIALILFLRRNSEEKEKENKATTAKK